MFRLLRFGQRLPYYASRNINTVIFYNRIVIDCSYLNVFLKIIIVTYVALLYVIACIHHLNCIQSPLNQVKICILALSRPTLLFKIHNVRIMEKFKKIEKTLNVGLN